jgi:hypothetical protein
MLPPDVSPILPARYTVREDFYLGGKQDAADYTNRLTYSDNCPHTPCAGHQAPAHTVPCTRQRKTGL